MKRRTFLKYLSTTPASLATTSGLFSYLTFFKNAFASNGKSLVVIFQRGGCDGLNSVIPYGDDDYYSLRPNISISPPNDNARSAIDLDGFFGLHPALAPFQEIFFQGDLAIFPTVHYPNANRSHFSSQDYIESGLINSRDNNGWLNKYLLASGQNNPFKAVGFGELPHSLAGEFGVSTLSNLSDLFLNSGENMLLNKFGNILEQQPNTPNQYKKLINHSGITMINNLKTSTALNFDNYTPATGTAYPENEYGTQLKQIAYLIKSEIGFEIGAINHNGWDTHANQGNAIGHHANKLADFSSGIAALYQDLGPQYMNDVVILTMTEFGRTVKQNASLGTDHGNASCWFIVGGGNNGGIYGNWPGLKQNELYLGRYLDYTIDYRDIFGEIIVSHLDSPGLLSNIIPNHNYQPVGFL